MSNRRTSNWATLLAVGLPLIVAGCAGAGNAPGPATDPAALAASKHVDALTLAEKLKSEGNYASAVTMYQQAHQAKPTDVRPLIGLGDSLLGVGANAEAANAYANALAMDANNLDALRGLGHARILLGQPQFAVTQYQTALKIAPHDARSLNGLGVAQDTLGDHAAAQANYRAVLATDPNNQSAKNNLALSLALSGDNAGAIKILEDVSKSATATAVNRQNLALIYGAAGQVDQAQQLSRTDLPADANRNINAIGAETDPAKREQLLKQSLGIELQGRQYTPPAAPAMPLTNLAQASVNDDPVYLSTDDSSGSLPMITTGKPDNALTAATAPAPIVKKHSSGDKWSDNWDEELVDAADLNNGQPNQPVVATPSKAAEQPLPAAPASTTTVVAATNTDTTAKAPAATDTTTTASATTPAATPAPSTPTPLMPQTASTTTSTTTAGATTTSTAATSIPSKFMSSSRAIGDDKPAATADAGPASSTAATPSVTPPAPTTASTAAAPSTASPVTASSEPVTPPAADAKPTETAAPTQVADSGTASTASSSAPSADPAPSKPVTVADAAGATAHADTATASTPAVTTTNIGAAKMFTVQIASYRSEAEATVGWQTLTTEQKDLLSGLPHTVEKADLGAGKGVYYRLKAGTFADAKAAKTLCTGLKNRSIDCMVVEAAPAAASAPTSTQQSMLAPKWIHVDPSALTIRTTATA